MLDGTLQCAEQSSICRHDFLITIIMRITLRKLLDYKPINSITLAAFIMAIAGVASRLLGFVRDRLLASTFGAGDLLDIYYAAFRLPDIIFDLLILGALSAAFIPLFTGLLAKRDDVAAWRLASGVFALLVSVLGGILAILFFATPAIVPWFVPGFSEEKMTLTITFTRIMLLSPLFLGMSAVFGGVLMSLKRFTLYALAPIFYNVGIIFGIIFFVPVMGPIGLAWSVVLGAVLHFAVTMPAAVACGFGQQISGICMAWRNKHVRRVLALMVPRMLGTASTQMSMIAVTFFASLTTAGTLAAFTFANNISAIPLGVIGVPFAVAAFPTLSAHFAKGDTDVFVQILVKYIKRTIFLVVPLMVILVTLRAQIVRVVLGAGAFDWHDTIMTFQILGILSLAVFALALVPLFARAFYAMHNTITPVITGMISVITTIAVIDAFLPIYDVYAIPVGVVSGALVNFVLLFVLLERVLKHVLLTKIHNAVLGALVAMGIATSIVYALARLEGLSLEHLTALTFTGLAGMWLGAFVFCALVLRVDHFYIRIIAMATLSATTIQIIKYVIGTVTDLSTFAEVFTQLVLAGGAGMSIYLLLGYLFGIDEFFVLRARVLRFILRRNLS